VIGQQLVNAVKFYEKHTAEGAPLATLAFANDVSEKNNLKKRYRS